MRFVVVKLCVLSSEHVTCESLSAWKSRRRYL